MIRYIKTLEVIFSTNNLSGMHISTMWHSLNLLKYICPLSVYIYMFICTELIEDTGRPHGLIFGMLGNFRLVRTCLYLGKIFSHLTEL